MIKKSVSGDFFAKGNIKFPAKRLKRGFKNLRKLNFL